MADRCRRVVVEQSGQVITHQIIERQATLAELQPERRPRERLAQRVHEPDPLGGVRRPVPLDDAAAVALDDQSVRLDQRVTLDRIEEGSDAGGPHSLR